MGMAASGGMGARLRLRRQGEEVSAEEAVEVGESQGARARGWIPISGIGARWLPQGFRRATICISSQVGCAVNCQFCLTAKLGIKRNLTAGEIAGQVAAVLNRHGVQMGKDRINLVFMGMGEPFLNYDAFMKSVRVLGGMGIPEIADDGVDERDSAGDRGFCAGDAMRPKLALESECFER